MNVSVPIATESKYLIKAPRECMNKLYLNSILPAHRGEEVRISLSEIYEEYVKTPEYRLIDAIRNEEAGSALILERIRENNEKGKNREVKEVGEVIDRIAAVFLGTMAIMAEIDKTFPGMIGERIDRSVSRSEEKGWLFERSLHMEWE